MSKAFPVRGLKELDTVLAALPERMQKQAYRAALTSAASIIRDEARLRAPTQTGSLAKGIKSGSPRQNQDGSFSIRVRTTGPHAFLGLFHEYGTASHAIASTRPRQGRRALSAAIGNGSASTVIDGPMKIGGDFVGGFVIHPGHRAQPFMRPALDAKAEEATRAFADRIKRFLGEKTGFNARALDEGA